MISFYPGPSRVYDEIPKYVKDAHKTGILSTNHRSDTFVKMCENTVKLLKTRLGIPKNYTVLFTSSATECWEIIAQSLITDRSYHIYNGSFGQKWYDYTKRIHAIANPIPFDLNEKLEAKKLIFDQHEGLICITQNETSNGTQVSNAIIRNIKRNNPNYLVAVDATSSMAGIKLDFKSADIWFASVQKCFGMPAGLGLMICSPQAVERTKIIGEKKYYNSLNFLIEMMAKWQTSYTPNVLAIYLLMRVLENMENIEQVQTRIMARYENWVRFLEQKTNISHFVQNKEVHSYTVIPVRTEAALMDKIKSQARKKGLLLGEGYGEFKSSTFRIANFPALKNTEIKILMQHLDNFG